VNSEELQSAYGPPESYVAWGRGWPKNQEYAERASEALENLRYNMNSYQRVREFMEAFGHPVYDNPTVIEDHGWEKMRLALIQEEFSELLDACGYVESARWIRDVVLIKDPDIDTNIIDAADALGDLEYVVNGMALGMGIDLPEVVREIHRSNMTKLDRDGKPIYREDGKVLKGEDYEPPNLEGVLYPE
jgi:predicted HAD superfamily Cof-like phosphohydrolase